MIDVSRAYESGELAPVSGIYLAKFQNRDAMHVMFQKDEKLPETSDKQKVSFSLAMRADRVPDLVQIHGTWP